MNIAQTIVEDLGRRIVRGDLTPDGHGLVEQDLVNDYEASRNIVREAVKTLAGKNLVRSERRVGTIVQPSKNWNLLDPQVVEWMLSEKNTHDELMPALSELRAIIEPEAAAFAAERATTKQILQLFDCYEDMKLHVGDPVEAIRHDVRFHETLLAACGNPLLRSFSHSISQLLQANFELSIQVDNAFIRNLDDHRLIAEKIQNRDPDGARDATLQLLAKNKSDMEKIRYSQEDGP